MDRHKQLTNNYSKAVRNGECTNEQNYRNVLTGVQESWKFHQVSRYEGYDIT